MSTINEMPTMVSATTYKKESGFPVLQIKFDDKSYYVGPFRKYCFQISDNDKFDGDMGSTRPLGPHFDDYLKNVPSLAKAEFIRMSAVTVIAEFCRGHKLMMPIKTKFDWAPDPVFYEFIKDCFNWIWPNEEWPYCILPYFDDKRNLLTYAKTIIPELNALYMCYHSCENPAPAVPEPDFYNNFVASKTKEEE